MADETAIIIIIILIISSIVGATLYFLQKDDCEGSWTNGTVCDTTVGTFTDTYNVTTKKGWFGKDCPRKDKETIQTGECAKTIESCPPLSCTSDDMVLAKNYYKKVIGSTMDPGIIVKNGNESCYVTYIGTNGMETRNFRYEYDPGCVKKITSMGTAVKLN